MQKIQFCSQAHSSKVVFTPSKIWLICAEKRAEGVKISKSGRIHKTMLNIFNSGKFKIKVLLFYNLIFWFVWVHLLGEYLSTKASLVCKLVFVLFSADVLKQIWPPNQLPVYQPPFSDMMSCYLYRLGFATTNEARLSRFQVFQFNFKSEKSFARRLRVTR